jgi:hypothetical protein
MHRETLRAIDQQITVTDHPQYLHLVVFLEKHAAAAQAAPGHQALHRILRTLVHQAEGHVVTTVQRHLRELLRQMVAAEEDHGTSGLQQGLQVLLPFDLQTRVPARGIPPPQEPAVEKAVGLLFEVAPGDEGALLRRAPSQALVEVAFDQRACSVIPTEPAAPPPGAEGEAQAGGQPLERPQGRNREPVAPMAERERLPLATRRGGAMTHVGCPFPKEVS